MEKKIRKKHKKSYCFYCNEQVKLLYRYSPIHKGGRAVLACDECIKEAKIGKYDVVNMMYSDDYMLS